MMEPLSISTFMKFVQNAMTLTETEAKKAKYIGYFTLGWLYRLTDLIEEHGRLNNIPSDELQNLIENRLDNYPPKASLSGIWHQKAPIKEDVLSLINNGTNRHRLGSIAEEIFKKHLWPRLDADGANNMYKAMMETVASDSAIDTGTKSKLGKYLETGEEEKLFAWLLMYAIRQNNVLSSSSVLNKSVYTVDKAMKHSKDSSGDTCPESALAKTLSVFQSNEYYNLIVAAEEAEQSGNNRKDAFHEAVHLKGFPLLCPNEHYNMIVALDVNLLTPGDFVLTSDQNLLSNPNTSRAITEELYSLSEPQVAPESKALIKDLPCLFGVAAPVDQEPADIGFIENRMFGFGYIDSLRFEKRFLYDDNGNRTDEVYLQATVRPQIKQLIPVKDLWMFRDYGLGISTLEMLYKPHWSILHADLVDMLRNLGHLSDKS